MNVSKEIKLYCVGQKYIYICIPVLLFINY